MLYKLLFILGMMMALTDIHASTGLTEACDYKSNDGVIILDSSKIRFDNQEECFSEEHKIIKQFRTNHSSVKIKNTTALQQVVGLALSGGGIKSSAFQLGLLSGLHKSRNNNDAPLLNEIDYISSVSGGSWANGAYISALETDEEFFNCLTKIASDDSTSTCKNLANILSDQQNNIKGSGDWQKQIIDNYLRGRDVTFKAIREQIQINPTRPFPIFLATHSNTMIERKDPKNFPFEFTPISISAIADCDSSETPCGFFRRYFRPLHWNNSPEKGFAIDFSEAKGISTVVEKYDIYEPADELHISHAMWDQAGWLLKYFHCTCI